MDTKKEEAGVDVKEEEDDHEEAQDDDDEGDESNEDDFSYVLTILVARCSSRPQGLSVQHIY